MDTLVLETPHGPAHAQLHPAPKPVGALVLGHGAGGGIGARDLLAARAAALGVGFSVALVEQPYRVAGRRSPAPAKQLDAAWDAVVAQLREGPLSNLPLVTGGRSAGARVACRTAAECRAAAVLCLAFPLQPPARRSGRQAESRQGELDAVTVPVLIVQGAGDPFGVPAPSPTRQVTVIKGNHSLTGDLPAVASSVRDWLPGVAVLA